MSSRKRAHDTLPQAVALRYERGSETAPFVVAKGRGEIAAAILAFARKHAVPVREDPDLLELLAACDIGAEIPAEMYAAVAQLLTYLYRMQRETQVESRERD